MMFFGALSAWLGSFLCVGPKYNFKPEFRVLKQKRVNRSKGKKVSRFIYTVLPRGSAGDSDRWFYMIWIIWFNNYQGHISYLLISWFQSWEMSCCGRVPNSRRYSGADEEQVIQIVNEDSKGNQRSNNDAYHIFHLISHIFLQNLHAL